MASSVFSRNELTDRAEALEVFFLDVDGVFTDGSIILTGDEAETKAFDVKDGMGVTLAQRAGLEVGIITGRVSDVVRRRANELDIERVFQGHFWKDEALEDVQEDMGIEPHCMAFMGDDVLDLATMNEVGLSFAPADAHSSARRESDVTLESRGGQGAIREAVDFLLELRDQKLEVYDHFSRGVYEAETE